MYYTVKAVEAEVHAFWMEAILSQDVNHVIFAY
jgi:hypothetical protein